MARSRRPGGCAPAWRPTPDPIPIPIPTMASTASPRVAFSFVSVMIVTLLSARAATADAAAPAGFPDTKLVTNSMVVRASPVGTAAPAPAEKTEAAPRATARLTPRAASRPASCFRARHSETVTEPSVQPSCRAASAAVFPSRQQRTNAARRLVGRRASSSSMMARTSRKEASIEAGMPAAFSALPDPCSYFFRRWLPRRVLIATRRATPCNQAATAPRSRTCPAFWARIRKVAWKASSASWSCPRTFRQTAQTVRPCRRTSSAKDASSRRSAKRRRSSASHSDRSAVWAITRRTCRRIVPCIPCPP